MTWAGLGWISPPRSLLLMRSSCACLNHVGGRGRERTAQPLAYSCVSPNPLWVSFFGGFQPPPPLSQVSRLPALNVGPFFQALFGVLGQRCCLGVGCGAHSWGSLSQLPPAVCLFLLFLPVVSKGLGHMGSEVLLVLTRFFSYILAFSVFPCLPRLLRGLGPGAWDLLS